MPNIGSILHAIQKGQIRKVDPDTNTAYISFPLSQGSRLFPVSIPAAWRGPKGEFSGGYPQRGSMVWCGMAQGNTWVIVGYAEPDGDSSFDSDGTRRVDLTKIRPGRYVTLVNNDVHHIVDPKDGIISGDSTDFMQADPDKSIFSTRFDQNMYFTQAHRTITGPVLRYVQPSDSTNVIDSALTGHAFNDSLKKVGLDPKSVTSRTFFNNPAFTESRSIYYEFEHSYSYSNDADELNIHQGGDAKQITPNPRREIRSDTMSLGLDNPNYLVESVVGTMVDVYGNIVDINRNILPNGQIKELSFSQSNKNSSEVFQSLRNQTRKSIAYHFELNARKDTFDLPKYNDTTDYGRSRSRLSLDIDKEGQFKINIPASSEEGNIGLLVRHENFSNLKGADLDTADQTGNRNAFIRNGTDNSDIKLDAFGKGVISLISNDKTIKPYTAPVDRITGKSITLGTAFHDITAGLYLHKINQPYVLTNGYPESILNQVTPITDVVSTNIITSGTGANAGGRSGTISLDGMLSVSIGANTIDRQSLWLDMAGGAVINIGRDRFLRSLSAQFDGDVLIQIGGATVDNDSRFPGSNFNNDIRDGALDIRIMNSGSMHIIRCDKQGLKIHTPQAIDVVAESDIRLKSVRGNIYLDAENIYVYSGKSGGGRLINRNDSTLG